MKNPEELEPGDIQRTTASVSHYRPLANGFWASSIVWGWNHKILEDRNIHSYLFESLWQFHDVNYLTGRLEIVDKDELFGHGPDLEDGPEHIEDEVFNIQAFTIGYARDFDLIPGFQTGAGASITFYSTPNELEPFYGDSPKGFFFYFRIRKGHGDH